MTVWESRTLVVWCPDWPLVAAGLAQVPSAVTHANRVVACSPPARAEGVRRHQRRREAEAACPNLKLVKEDPAQEVRVFEQVVSAVAQFTPRVEVTRPGMCSLPVRGPARYFGGERAFANRLTHVLNGLLRELRGPPCRIGIADTPFAARLAAHVPPGEIVLAGSTAAWLADLPVSALGEPELAELLVRLGIRRLGEFAELDEGVVAGRFGSGGVRAHRLARGLDDHALALSEPPPDLTVARELDSPIDQVDTVAFVAAGLAEELIGRLAPDGLACTRLLVEASTEHGEELSRWWRADRPFTARAMVDRVRWQLEGWLTAPVDAPSAGITLVRLSAGEVVPDKGRQLGLFGGPVEADQRVERGIARIQGLLGHTAVGTAVPAGGRGPAEQAIFVPWGDPREEPEGVRHPWPGRLPAPAPAVVPVVPVAVGLVGRRGETVGVTGRGQCTVAPEWLLGLPGTAGPAAAGQRPPGSRPSDPCPGGGAREVAHGRQRVVGWAGPWPADERWWDPTGHRRRARLQVLLEDGSAHLLVLECGRWGIEATYD